MGRISIPFAAIPGQPLNDSKDNEYAEDDQSVIGGFSIDVSEPVALDPKERGKER
jgi:hypothetical protein